MSELERAVATVVDQCLVIREGEEVVVVVDNATRAIGDALRDAAAQRGAEAVLTVMDPRPRHGAEPPAAVAGALKEADVFIAPTSRSLTHTRARKAASEAGARGATLPGVTEDMLARLMACDFETLQRRSRALADLLSDADEARFTCPRGSEFTLDLTGRTGMPDDGDLAAPTRSATCRAARASSPRCRRRGRWWPRRWPRSASPGRPGGPHGAWTGG